MKFNKLNIGWEIILSLILFSISCQESESDSFSKSLHTENGVLYINDKPFIPTGIYFWPDISSPTGRDPFEDIAMYGLNTLVAYYEYVRPDRKITNQPNIRELREKCDRLGIYYFIGAPNGMDLAGKSDSELEALFKATTKKVADSPHFLGWMFDEPILNNIDLELMKRTAAAIRRYPTDLLIWINFAPLDEQWNDPQWPDMTTYAQLGDIVGFDFYPVEMGLPWEGYISKYRLEDFGWFVDQALIWVSEETPIWMIQQGWKKGDLMEPPTKEGRRPDAIETRFMSYQAMVHGASGLFYFPGSRLGGAIPFDDPTWDDYIRNTVASIKNLSPVLTSFDLAEEVSVSSSEIRFLTKKLDGNTTIIAVRETDGSPITVTFDLSETINDTLEVIEEERQIVVADSSFTDEFNRYAVHIYQQN